MNKNIRKINAILTLAAFIITSIMTITPATAWAEGETPTEPAKVSLTSAKDVAVQAGVIKKNFVFKIVNAKAKDKLEITFPESDADGITWLQPAKNNGGSYTVAGQTVKYTLADDYSIEDTLEIDVNLSTKATLGAKAMTLKYKLAGNSSGEDITLAINPAPIKWGEDKDESIKNSSLTVNKANCFVPADTTEDPVAVGKIRVVATLDLKDSYNNGTTKTDGKSIYIWMEHDTTLAQVDGEPAGDAQLIPAGNCSLKRIGKGLYRIDEENIKASTISVPFVIDAKDGNAYKIYAVQSGTADTNDITTLRNLRSKLSAGPIELSLMTLVVENSGNKITTHTSPDEPGQISVSVTGNLSDKQWWIKLPKEFVADGEKKSIQEGDNTFDVYKIPASGAVMNIIGVPSAGEGIYNDSSQFDLYDDKGIRYEPVKKECSITVDLAGLNAKITNKLAFRYGTNPTPTMPHSVDFEIKDISSSGNQMVFYVPKYVDGTTDTEKENSDSVKKTPIIPRSEGNIKVTFADDWAPGGTNPYMDKNYSPADYYEVVASGLGTQVQPVPISIPATVEPKGEGYNEKITIPIKARRNQVGNLESGSVTLYYRVTDKIVSLEASSITAPVEQQEFVDAEGHTVYQTTATVKINSNVLNGRKLYAWVDREKASGGNGDQLAKARFEIKIDNDKMPAGNKNQLRTINSLVDEGTAAGSNNLFAITNIAENALDDDLNIALSEGGDYEIPLVITSLMPGEQFYIRVAVGETAQQAYVSSAQLESDPFDFVGVGEQPILTLSNNGIIYDSKPYGSIHYQLENISGLQAGDEIKIGLPAALDKPASAVGVSTREDTGESGGTTPEPDPGEDDKPTNIRPTVQWLTVKLGQPDNNGIYSGDISLGDTYIKEIAADDEGKKESVEIAIDDNSGCYLQVGNKNWSPMFFKGLLTITPRPPEADIAVSFAPKSGITVSANDKKQLVSGNTAVVDMTLTDRRDVGASFGESVLLVWLEDDGQILKDTSHITFDLTKHPAIPAITEKAKSGQQALTIFKTLEEKAKTVTIPVTLQNLTDLGEYQLKAQLVTPTIEDGKIIGYDPGINRASGFVFDVIAAPEEAWQIKTIIANGDTLSGSAANVFTAGYQKVDTELSIKVLLQDKDGKPLAGKSISNASLDTTNKLTLSPTTAVTDKDGYAAFTVTPTIEGTFNIRLTAQEDRADMAMATLQIPVNQEGGGSSNVPDYYDLEIRRMTSTVARDGRASIYIEVFDRDDDQIMVTTSDMVNKIISSVRLTEIPSTSDLTRSSISVRRLGHGIEVYFVPDVAGSYEVTINGGGTNTPVLRPDITAVRQGKVVEMELEYPESTLRIGQSSSPAIVYTYDADGVKAEKALTANGMEISANGSAVESIDDMGIVKVRDNERYAGNTIRVTVVDEKLSLAADYVFNVDEYGSSNEGNTGGITGTNDIVLWDNYGGVGMTNRFEFYLTDSSGFKTVLDSGQMSSSNNASATVSIVSRPAGSTVHASIYNSGRTLEDNGYGYLDVYCSKEGLVRLNVTIKVYDPDETRNYSRRYSYYRKTVELNMTKNITSGNMNNIGGSYSNPIGNNNGVNAADVNVAMFVGSTKYTVNMMQRELDTAPYVDNGRTFVPLRALSDGLGAAVSFDDDTQTITIIYNGERAELVIGSDVVATTKRGTYRVDTAPVIENERTMVPLRIAAEALGCQVEAVYNQYGSTIGAVFSK